MRLVECYIENFGTLKQYRHTFDAGLNTINEVNGWGKSTFATFIKAMFYGMETSRKKNIDEVERRKYKPWQGGKYGGYLVFEVNGRTYKIERFFGEREKGDTFALYDQSTGLPSKDYGENIGEAVFRLDRAAYARSTYIPQNVIAIEANDSIAAKLSDLMEDKNDINHYEAAMNALDKRRKILRTIGSRGKVDKTAMDIAKLEAELEQCKTALTALEQWNQKQHTLLAQKSDLKDKLAAMRTQVEMASTYEAGMAKLLRYKEIYGELLKAREALAPLSQFFNGQLPTQEDVERFDELGQALLKLQGEVARAQLKSEDLVLTEELEHFFAGGVPKDDLIQQGDALFADVQKVDMKLASLELNEWEIRKNIELEAFFAKGLPEEHEIRGAIDDVSTLNDVKSKISTEKSKLELLRAVQTTPVAGSPNFKSIRIVLLALSGILTVLGIALMSPFPYVGLGLLLAGLMAFGLGYSWAGKATERQVEEDRQRASRQSELLEIQRFIDELSIQKASLEEGLRQFLQRFPVEIASDNYFTGLTTIRARADEYRNLMAKLVHPERNALKTTRDELLGKLEECFAPFGGTSSMPMSDWEALWDRVKRKRWEYLTLRDRRLALEQVSAEYTAAQAQYRALLSPWFGEFPDNPVQAVQSLREKLREQNRLSLLIANLEQKKGLFEQENEVAALEALTPPLLPLEECRAQERMLEETLEKSSWEESALREQIRRLSEQTEKFPDMLGELERLKEELKQDEQRLEILNKTMDCLERARKNLAGNYLDKMHRGFENYLKLLDRGGLGPTEIDVHLNVHVTAHGARHPLDFFSTGYKDLVGICIRLSLVEALFEAEPPFLILDDSFVNLDEGKLDLALEMLREISKKHQILYFVCHASRRAN